MPNQFLTNYTETTFLDKIKDNLRKCKAFHFSVSFIKKASLVLLFREIEAAVERGAKGRIITSTYQNFTDIESLKSFYSLVGRYKNFECHLDYECFHDTGYFTLGYHSKGYLFEFDDACELIVGSSNITRFAFFAQNFVLEKRLIQSLVRDNFSAIGLSQYGVEINIDDLSKEEILEYIDKENFNSIKYLKQDYFNFKKYINSEFYPKHMDYINNDCAPDIIRYEFEIIHSILNGISNIEEINAILEDKIVGYHKTELAHALKYLQFVTNQNGLLNVNVKIDD